ncbi:MAG: helix-turn-helix domain-containing protein, partial [Bacteroidota bacterium]
VPLPELFGPDGLRLEKSILDAPTTEERIRHIEAFLLGTLTSAENIDRIAKLSVECILELNGKLSVDELSARLNINRRQLERKFSTAIGLSPKQLSKVIRLQSVLKMMATKGFTSLSSVAYEGEYYDQAHFIKDFKEFTGLSPKQFYAGNLKMSALFSGTE